MFVYKYALPILSGLLLAVGFSPVAAPFLMWIALVPLFFFLAREKRSKTDAIFGGLIAGSIAGITLLTPLVTLDAWWWVSPESFWFAYRELLFALFVGLVAIIGGGFFFALFSALYILLQQNRAGEFPRFAIIFALLWSFFEYFRTLLVGFSWGALGYGFYGDILAIQITSVTGVYGLSFIIVYVNIFIAHALVHRSRRVFGVAFVLPIALYAYGAASFASHSPNDSRLSVAVVHPAQTTEESGGIEGYRANLKLLEEAASKKGGAPNLIVAPENIFPFFIIEHETLLPRGYDVPNASLPALYNELRGFSRMYPETTLIFGVHSTQNEKRFNSMVIMEHGDITDIYNKRALLVFGEKQAPFLQSNAKALVAGKKKQTFGALGEIITPLICSEVAYPNLAQSKNSLFIVIISNDGLFLSPAVGKQNHIQATFRAVENRQYVLRSVKGGISSIIDPYGRTVGRSEDPSASEIITGNIMIRSR